LEVEMQDITKRFGDVQALAGVSLRINPGEVLGLVGENGAGKTTLMNILFGLYRADSGRILINGEEVQIKSPRDSISRGIFMVHQHFKLVRNFTALENIILGTTRGMEDLSRLDLRRYRIIVEELMREHKLEVPLDEKVRDLPIGVQQRVEILKALYRQAELLILDEPTTNLTPQETEALLASVLEMKKRRISVVLITHKVKEVLETVDRVVVLRRGRVVGELWKGEMTAEKIVELMVGRRVDLHAELSRALEGGRPSDEEVLRLEDLRTEGEEVDLKGVSLSVRKGEILGIAGVAGNGQRELCEAIMGIAKTVGGRVIYKGTDFTKKSVRERIEAGFRFVPEDRVVDGSLPTMSLSDNVLLGYHWFGEFQKRGFLIYEKIDQMAKKAVEEYEIKAPGIRARVGRLSGGNIQKVVVARALAVSPELLVAYNPTRGLDVGMTEKILKKLIELRNSGVSIVLVSEDLDELMLVSDRIAVMYKGEIVGVLERGEFDKKRIGLLMAGVRGGAA